MAGGFRIAEGYVEVTADESGYERSMQRLRQSKNKATVTLDLDDTAALAKLRQFADRHSRTVLKAVIDAQLSESAMRRVSGQLDRLTADRVVNIRASVDTRVAAQEIRNLTQRRTVRIGIDVDTRVAADSIANLTRRRTMTVQASADTAAARARLDFLTRDRTVNVRANTLGSLGGLSGLGSSASSAAGGVGMLGSRFAMLASAALLATPAVASLGQAIIQMGPAAAVAVPALGALVTMGATLAVGLHGVGDAFKAASQSSSQGSAGAASAARALAAANLNVVRSARALKEAQTDAARQIADAQKRVGEAAEDVRDAEVQAAADRQAALRRVQDAERDLTDAIQDAKQAQKDLTEARKEAADQLEDLNSRLANAQLDQRQAVLDLQDAEANLAAVKAKGSAASAKDLAEAQLSYDKALQRLKDQQTETERLTEETTAANKAGVEGSATVAAAQQKVADSQRTVGDRTREVRDAQAEAAKTAKDGAEAVRDAQARLADAQQGVADAQVAASRQVRAAQEALADAQRSVAAATEKGATAANKYADAMAKLSPNARAFVTAVRGMGGAFSALRMDVQDRLFRGLGDSFTRMATASLPALRSGLGGMADVLNRMGRGLMDTFTRLANGGLLTRMFKGFTDGMAPLAKIPGQLGEAFVKVGIAAAPALKRVTSGMGGFFDRMMKQLDQAFKNGHLEKIINQALDVAVQFGHLIGDIFGTLGNVMKAASAAGGDALGALGSVFKELRRITAMPEVQKALTEIFKAVNAVAKLVAGVLGSVIQAALPLLAKLAPVVTELANKFGPVLIELVETLGKALMPIIDALLPVVTDIGDILIDLVRGLTPLLQPLGNLIGAIVKALAPVVSALGAQLVPVVAVLAKSLAPVIQALVPAVQTLGVFIGQLAPLFPQLLTAMLPLIPPLTQLVTSFLDLALQVITPLMPLIVSLARILTGALTKSINDLVPPLVTVIGWMVTFTDGVTHAVKWSVDQFKWALARTKETFTQLKQAVTDRWNALWKSATDRWNSFWTGLRTSLSNAKTSMTNWVSGVRTSVANTWSSMWSTVTSKTTSVFSTLRSKMGEFKTSMLNSVRALRDGIGSLWSGIQSRFAGPVKWVVGHVYNDGLRKMWNSIAGKINSKITLNPIPLGFNRGGVVPGTGNSDTVPAMLTPGERILSNGQVAKLGGHKAIDAMLGQDRPTKTGGNPSQQEERRRYQGPTQHFVTGGIVGKVTNAVGSAVSGAASWAKDLVVGGLRDAAAKALSALVRPLISRIPGGPALGGLLKGMANRAVDGMMGWFGNEDKKALGGPAVQKALAWAKTQNGKPYQWGGNNNPSWDCSGLISGIESVIRGERPHRRWATGAFVGNSGPAGWVRNLKSPFMIGITNAGVGHTAGTLAGVNVESRGGDGVVIGKGARGYNDRLFTSQWGFAPVAKYDSGGLLADGATMVVNQTRKPERILDPRQTELFEQLVTQATTNERGGVTIEEINFTVHSLSMPSLRERRDFANGMVREINEALRKYNKSIAR